MRDQNMFDGSLYCSMALVTPLAFRFSEEQLPQDAVWELARAITGHPGAQAALSVVLNKLREQQDQPTT